MIAAATLGADQGILWSEYRELYLERLKLFDVRHYQTGRDALAKFSAHMDPHGRLRLAEIDNALFTQYLAKRRQDPGRGSDTLAVSTLNKDIRYLNTAFGFALPPTEEHPDRLGVIADTWKPPRARRLKPPKKRPKPVPDQTLQKLLDACKHAPVPKLPNCSTEHWWQTLYLTFAVTGVRCETLLEVPRPSDDDLGWNVFRVPPENDKTSEERLFHIPGMLVAMIRAMHVAPRERLFAWPYGRRHFYRVIHAWQAAAGIPEGQRALPHGMRRTKGTLLTKQGCSLPLVSDEMGHASMQTTMQFYIGELTPERVTAVETMFAALPIPDELKERYSPEPPAPEPEGPQLRLFYGDSA